MSKRRNKLLAPYTLGILKFFSAMGHEGSIATFSFSRPYLKRLIYETTSKRKIGTHRIFAAPKLAKNLSTSATHCFEFVVP